MDEDSLDDRFPKTAEKLAELKVAVQGMLQIKEEIKRELKAELEEEQKNLMQQYTLIQAEIKELEERLKSNIQAYFDSSEFMESFRKQVMRFVEQQISVGLSEQGVNEIIISKIEQNLRDDFNPIITAIVEKTLRGLQKRFSGDVQRAKELCYSVESEITHLTQRTGISVSMEELIRKRVDRCFSEMQSKRNTRRQLEISRRQ